MQLFDESPMVGFIHDVNVAKTMLKDHKVITKYATFIQISVTLHLYFKYYQICLDGFTLMVLQDAVLEHLLKFSGPTQR